MLKTRLRLPDSALGHPDRTELVSAESCGALGLEVSPSSRQVWRNSLDLLARSTDEDTFAEKPALQLCGFVLRSP